MALELPSASQIDGARISLATAPGLVTAAIGAALEDRDYRKFGPFPDDLDPLDEMKRRRKLIDAQVAVQWAVVERKSGLISGLVELSLSPHREKTIDAGYWIVPTARRMGLATEALSLATAWAEEATQAQRIELCIDPENHPSIRVAEKAGYGYYSSVVNSPAIGPRPEAELYVWHRETERIPPPVDRGRG